MKRKKVKWSISTGYVGCTRQGSFYVDEEFLDDDVPEDAIAEAAREFAFECVEWDWEIVEEDGEAEASNG